MQCFRLKVGVFLNRTFFIPIFLGLLDRLRQVEGRWVMAIDATSQISSEELSVIFCGILHEDHGFLPILASMQVIYLLLAPFFLLCIF